jgi:hypothetical protein
MLYALRYEKESPVQLMQLFNKLASRSPKYKSGVCKFGQVLELYHSMFCSMAHGAFTVFILLSALLGFVLPFHFELAGS